MVLGSVGGDFAPGFRDGLDVALLNGRLEGRQLIRSIVREVNRSDAHA